LSTPERSQSYGRVVRTLRDVAPSKLLPREQETIREAADALLFTADPLDDADAVEAVTRVEALAAHLAETGRWDPERAAELVDDVIGCGLVPVAVALGDD
jgi:hypothetical protein